MTQSSNEKTPVSTTGEWIAFIGASAFMVTRVATTLYKRVLNVISQRLDTQHPTAAEKIRLQRAQLKQSYQTEIDELKNKGQRKTVVYEDEEGNIGVEFRPPESFGTRLLNRYGHLLPAAVASMHMSGFYAYRRFFSETESRQDSFNESLAATLPTFAGLIYTDLKSAYSHTLKFSIHRNELNRLVEEEKKGSKKVL